jgi:hypothetical protein
MKKRLTITAAIVALLTLSAASTASAIGLFHVSGSGVLVRQDDGYIITGTLRDADSQLVGTIHGTLVERTTGFNSCPYFCFFGDRCFPPPGIPAPACNLLGPGEVTLNFQGTIYDANVDNNINGRIDSSLCKNPNDPSTYELTLFMWSVSHVPPGEFPDFFELHATVQQISPTVFKWSS